MKKKLLLFILILSRLLSYSQMLKQDGECTGIGKLVLGNAKANYTTYELKGGKYTKDGHEFNIYGYGDGVEMLSTNFTSVMLTFNDSNYLVSFIFIKFYKKSENPHFEKDAKKFYNRLTEYATKELNYKGENKTYNRSSIATEKGMEWNGTQSSLQIKRKNTSYYSTIELSLSYQRY